MRTARRGSVPPHVCLRWRMRTTMSNAYCTTLTYYQGRGEAPVRKPTTHSRKETEFVPGVLNHLSHPCLRDLECSETTAKLVRCQVCHCGQNCPKALIRGTSLQIHAVTAYNTETDKACVDCAIASRNDGPDVPSSHIC